MTIKIENTDSHCPPRDVFRAMFSGFMLKCPSCNHGRIFGKYLKVNHQCGHCGEELHFHRADDAPPYFTIFIVGHIVVPLMMAIEVAYKPNLWLQLSIWLPLTVALCYWILPRVKGALIGLQWANYMHGFHPDHDEAEEYGGHVPQPVVDPKV